tara:strand:+ start:1639 stop:1986 length:348 start_codon:yes stop_codon:yes gene_type:complete
MDNFRVLINKDKYIVKRLDSTIENHTKWVGIQPKRDKNTYGTKINPKRLEIIYSIFIFEMNNAYLDEGQDISLDMSKNVESTYASSVDEIINYLETKNICIENFVSRSDLSEYPL